MARVPVEGVGIEAGLTQSRPSLISLRPSWACRFVEFTRQVDQIHQDTGAGDERGCNRQCVQNRHFQPPREGFHPQPGFLDTGISVSDPTNALTVNGADRS